MRLTSWRLRNSDVLLVYVWRFRGRGGNGYTLGMDSVRFGRVLGIGARLAAKTMVSAVDAATAPNPSAAKAKQDAGGDPAAGSSSTTPELRVRDSAEERGVHYSAGAADRAGLKRAASALARRCGGRLEGCGSLWLELTGSSLGIFRVFAAETARERCGALAEIG
jgi:hypothetical protein